MSTQNGMYRFTPQGAPGSNTVDNQRQNSKYPAYPDSTLVAIPQMDGTRKYMPIREAEARDLDFVLISETEQKLAKIKMQATASGATRYAEAVGKYFAIIFKLAADETLTETEATELVRLQIYLNKYDGDTAAAVDKAKAALQARVWLTEHQGIADAMGKADAQIAKYEQRLADFLEKIRAEAAPSHARKAQLLKDSMYSVDAKYAANFGVAELAGNAVPPAGWRDPGNI